MPNPTASIPFDPSQNMRPDVMPMPADQSSMPLNPAGLISMQAPLGASTTGSMTSGSVLPQNLPQPYSGFWSSFQTWAQNNPWSNNWWQNWGNWFQNWSQQATGDTAGASTDNASAGLSILPGPPQINPQIPVVASGPNTRDGGPENPGVGQYIPTTSYLLTPAGQAGIRGLGGLGCGCGCSAPSPCGCNGGMGTLGDGTGFLGSGLFNGNGLFGAGLFEGGWDVTTWGPAEWAVLVIGGYVVFSTVWTTGKALEYGGTQKARLHSKVKRATTFNLLGM